MFRIVIALRKKNETVPFPEGPLSELPDRQTRKTENMKNKPVSSQVTARRQSSRNHGWRNIPLPFGRLLLHGRPLRVLLRDGRFDAFGEKRTRI